MKALAETDILQRLSTWRPADMQGRALAYVRDLYGDPEIGISQLIGAPLDFLKASDQEHCLEHCPGRDSCPDRGIRWSVSMEDLNGRRVFLVRAGKCRPRQDAERQRKAEILVSTSRIPEGMKRCTFETFVTAGMDPAVRTAKGLAMACVEDGSSLVLGGGTGVGKTHLAVAMVQELVSRGKCAIFVPTVDLLDEVRAGYESGKADQIQRGAREADCLVLDDLGAQRTTDWVAERLFALLDDRYRNGRQTVITTNAISMKDLSEGLGDRGARITSRLSESAQALFIKARDYRTRKNTQTKLPAE